VYRIRSAEFGVWNREPIPHSKFPTPHSGVWGCTRNCDSDGVRVSDSPLFCASGRVRDCSSGWEGESPRTCAFVAPARCFREPADEPGDLPACVTRIPTAIADSLTANNLRDLRLVACLLQTVALITRSVPSVSDAGVAQCALSVSDAESFPVGPVQPPEPQY
jgi:hypothetical protein